MHAFTLACAALALAVSGSVTAATFNVTKTADTDDGVCDADCSLREAIVASNANATTADTINLPAGTYGRSSAHPQIVGSLSIVGAGAATTQINAGGLGRVLNFTGQSFNDRIALVSGVTITGGNATYGAGVTINNYGTVTLRKVTIRDNVVTGAGAGGGILVFPDRLVVEDSTLSGNSASEGGALFINTNTSATLRNVTISGNTASQGSAIQQGSGPGIDIGLTNVTITGNQTNQGAAIHNFHATVTFKNTIVSDNTPANCFVQYAGSFVSAGHNLDSGGSCGLTGTGDLSSTDPLLGPLQNNSGPTFTHALTTGSPAIDAGNNVGCPAADQRGEPRPTDGDSNSTIVCDIGAYEAGGTTHAAATPPGNDVMVEPLPPSGTTTTPVVVTFDAVTEGGYTNLVESTSGPANTGFKLGNPPLFFDISTSAGFTPPVEVCIDYSTVTFTNENNIKLFHFENGVWVNATSNHDKVNDIICGLVNSLSPFAMFEDEADTVPDAFTFIDVIKVPPNKTQTSNAVTITGIDAPSPISVSGGEYQIVNVTGWTTVAGTISNGQQVRVRHLSSRQLGTTTNTTLTVGDVSDTFSSKTVPKKK